jgi:hypothetical protein
MAGANPPLAALRIGKRGYPNFISTNRAISALLSAQFGYVFEE